MPKKTTTTPKALLPVVVLVLVALAPFVGGRDILVGTAVLSAVAAAAGIAFVWSRGYARPVAFWPLAVFVGILALSAISTASIHATIEKTMYFAACAILCVIASSTVRSDRWFVSILFAVAGAGLVLGALGVREYAMHFKAGEADWRVFATFLNPGFFGGYLTMAIPVTLAVFLATRSPAVAFGAGLSWAFEVAALFLTGTRFAIASTALALIVLLALVLWTRSLRRPQMPRTSAAVLVGVVVILLTLAPTTARLKGKAAAEQAHSGPFRVATWKGTANIITAHPLLGTGAGTFELVFPRYMVAGYARMAHQGYLQIASEAGIPALGAAAVAFAVLFIAGIRGLKREDGSADDLVLPGGSTLIACAVVAAIVGSLARNLMDSDIYLPAIGFTFWALAGLAASRAPERTLPSLSTTVRVGLTAVLAAIVVLWSTFALGQMFSDAGWAALEDDDPLSAIEAYGSAARIDPLKADHWLRNGQIAALSLPLSNDSSYWKAGIKFVKRAITLEPTRARNVIVLARLQQSHGDTEAALKSYLRALELDPHATPAMLAAARLMDEPDADRMYQRMIVEEKSLVEQLRGVPEMVNPDYAWAHQHFGLKYLKQDRREDAAKHFRAAIERLERRKSNKKFLEIAVAAGIAQPEDEDELDQLLADCRKGLEEAEE